MQPRRAFRGAITKLSCSGQEKAIELPAPSQFEPESRTATWLAFEYAMPRANDYQQLKAAISLQQKGDIDEAARLCRAIIKRNPSNFHALHFLGIVEASAGNIEEAKHFVARSLQTQPRNIQFMENYATIVYLSGDYTSALQICDNGLRLQNDSISLLYISAISMFKLKRFKDALGQFDRLLLLQPNHPVAHNEKASVLANMNQYDAAFASVENSLNIDPMYADAHLNKGNLYSETKRYNEALAAYDKALRFKPNLANAWLGRGNVFYRLKRYDEALATYDKALRFEPNLANAWLGRGNVFYRLKRYDEALAGYDKALTFDPALAYAWYGRGNVFRDLHRLEEALTNFDKALALEPHFAIAFDRKGRTLLELGRLSEANSAIERAINLKPRTASFYLTLALSKRLAPGDPYVRAMVEFARDMSSFPIEEQIDLNFALAKAFEGNEDHERSFRHLMDGNALKRKQMAYDEAATVGVLERTQAAFTRQLMRSNEGRGDPSFIPVFIFGMPRSGTTLVEQILAGHPKVFGAGEIFDFDHAVAELSGAAREVLNNPEAISLMSGEQLRELGASYVGRIRRAAPEAARITNKMPSNFLFAGLIHLALPNARIIHTRRDPVDTCFSCFSTLFAAENTVFTYDMVELGRYYRAYEALMAHWRAVLPQNRMLEVQYEEVVADLEEQTRRILDHCGLEWDARCLNFHETARPVLTASVVQVRQPIYKSSVGRSRDYERFLEPLLAELAPVL